MPFFPSALGNRLEYELTFNDYGSIIKASGDTGASYTIHNISLEFDTVSEPSLARTIRNQYAGRLAILYDRTLCFRKVTLDKTQAPWNINLIALLKA